MKTVIITGANSGLGFETAKKIAKDENFRVILACRNKEKGLAAKEEIIKETNNQNIMLMIIDTSSLSSVRSFVEDFKKLNLKLDVLICNAGISSMHNGTTEDGFELVFATNHLGHFLLTNLLLPYMNKDARILNITSDMHNPPGGIEWQGVEYLAHQSVDDRKRYAYSKLCNIYFTYELAERLEKLGSKITVNAFNPGMMKTNFGAGPRNPAQTAFIKMTMPNRVGDLNKSSLALSQVATQDEFSNLSGKYFDRSTKFKKSSDLSYNKENMLELWNQSVALTNLKPEETIKDLLN